MGISFDLPKPKEFETRTLRYEKPITKKLGLPGRVMQNGFTHYNYFYNANRKLNDVLNRAKASFTDDYSQLIPFYNYTLDATAKDSVQLDSIAYKAQSGIVLHDPRNDWADNMYLIWGVTYYLKKQYDSALMMFQFINYAFAKRDKYGDRTKLGSVRDGNEAFSIATKESKSITKKIFSEPPSRNDAFIWQVRTLLAMGETTEAGSLLSILRDDPKFPHRLQNDIDELTAYIYYKQQNWDSSAAYLIKALDNAPKAQDKARWQFLIGQILEKTENAHLAQDYYSKAVNLTTDLIMEVYARLAILRTERNWGGNRFAEGVNALTDLAKRDKYSDYQDIIYFMAAQLEIERNNPKAALPLLVKSVSIPANNDKERNKAYVQLGKLAFSLQEYPLSYDAYSRINMDDPSIDKDVINTQKDLAQRLATATTIIYKQDSLQRVANMPQDDRHDFIKKLVKQLRKDKGLKEEGATTILPKAGLASNAFKPNSKGDWYFYNEPLRKKGTSEFMMRWGRRPNVDNWRRSSSMMQSAQYTVMGTSTAGLQSGDPNNELTYENVLQKFPVTPEKMAASNDSIQQALFTKGTILVQELEDCEQGIHTFEELVRRYPSFSKIDNVYYNLYYCYKKTNDNIKAVEIRNILLQKFPASEWTAQVNNAFQPVARNDKAEATKAYEDIYNLFVEGKFDEAINKKKEADALFSKNYWNPQLMYVQGIYYVKQRQDSLAAKELQALINQFPSHALSQKASALIAVLARRSQIEAELQNLNVTRNEDNNTPQVTQTTIPAVTQQSQPQTVVPIQVSKDSVKAVTAPVASDVTPVKPGSYTFNKEESQYVILTLTKVDPVFINEAKNAFNRYNKEKYYNKQISLETLDIATDLKLIIMSPFKDVAEALTYIEQVKPKAAIDIVPWLKADKYSFSFISAQNLVILKAAKDWDAYKTFISQQVPGK